MSHRKRIALAVIGWLLFSLLMGLRQDLPTWWMRAAVAAIAGASLWFAFVMLHTVMRERRRNS